jgi:hypothetical protein
MSDHDCKARNCHKVILDEKEDLGTVGIGTVVFVEGKEPELIRGRSGTEETRYF